MKKSLLFTFTLATVNAFSMTEKDSQKLTHAQQQGDTHTVQQLAQQYELKTLLEQPNSDSSSLSVESQKEEEIIKNEPNYASGLRAATIPQLNCIPDDVANLIFQYADFSPLLFQKPLLRRHASMNSINAHDAWSIYKPAGNSTLPECTDNFTRIKTLKGTKLICGIHYLNARTAYLNPKSNHILAIDSLYTAKLLNFDGTQQTSFKHNMPVLTAIFNAAGDRILTASADGVIRLWLLDGTEIARFIDNPQILSAIFINKPEEILTLSRDQTACIWEVPILNPQLTNSQVALLLALEQNLKNGNKYTSLTSEQTMVLTSFSDILKKHLIDGYGIVTKEHSNNSNCSQLIKQISCQLPSRCWLVGIAIGALGYILHKCQG